MTRFMIKRLVYAVPILLGVAVIVFGTVKIIPGDPVALLAGMNSTEEQKQAIRSSLGLDQNVIVQFWRWFSNAVTGDLGTSIAQHRPAGGLVFSAFGNTLILALYAMVIALVLGVLLGSVAALMPKSWIGKTCSAISSIAVSAPQYSVALLFIIFVALGTGAFPVSGIHGNSGRGLVDLLWHGFLPALTSALVPAGMIGRVFRASLLDALSMDFVEALHARGLSRYRVLGHAMHNTLPSLLTMAGLQVGYLLGGVVFVETIFSWPGLGQLLFSSISNRDLPVTQAGVLVSAAAFVLVNIVVDSAHALIDSRVRTA
ncbi:peptide/nickel transport system permease protein [Kribbella aluminosa]|uniref:Peptide/nickel transport system permease protein n=1 Tax=Kribbella aluminosa TaxID=416017 RepID=A0ABS4UN22_9ACTN|nr:ABC transporter permease [Kribbella aluminosa]MBP2353014.1 peptide/nickel transport system permease protein [Kribbella aluminosa]